MKRHIIKTETRTFYFSQMHDLAFYIALVEDMENEKVIFAFTEGTKNVYRA